MWWIDTRTYRSLTPRTRWTSPDRSSPFAASTSNGVVNVSWPTAAPSTEPRAAWTSTCGEPIRYASCSSPATHGACRQEDSAFREALHASMSTRGLGVSSTELIILLVQQQLTRYTQHVDKRTQRFKYRADQPTLFTPTGYQR